MAKVRARGATEAGVVSAVMMIARLGVQTPTLARPILKEDLAKAGKARAVTAGVSHPPRALRMPGAQACGA